MGETVVERWRQRMQLVEGCTLPQTVPALLDAAVDRFVERPALVFFDDKRTLSYGALRELSCRLANGLAQCGLAKGMRVGVMLGNRPEFPITWLAIARLGAVMVPINPSYTPRELTYVLSDSSASTLVIEDASLPTLDQCSDRPAGLEDDRVVVVGDALRASARRWADLVAGGAPSHAPAEPIHRDDLLNIQYTSGTTGFPKGCMLSHDYWLVISRSAFAIDRDPAARMLSAQPWFYMDPQWHFLKALWSGAAVYCAKRPSLSRYIFWVKQYGIEWCQFPQLAMQQPEALDDGATRLKQAFLSGWRGEMVVEFERRFKVIGRDIFGMTEIGTGTAMPFDADDMVGSGSCGLPGPWRRARICDAKGREVGPGEIGELEISGRAILQGYWNKKQATEAACRKGWFRTGDLFRRDERGYYYIVGRIKEMIRRSGENISAQEIEAVVQMLPEISDVAAVAVPDPKRGEEVKLCVQLKPGIARSDCSVERIEAHCRSHLAPFKVPRYYAYLDVLPRTSSDKIAKHLLTAPDEDARRDSFDRVDALWR